MRELFLMALNDDLSWVVEEFQLFRTSKDKELNRLYREHIENVKAIREVLKRLIAEGKAAGELDIRLGPDIVAMALMGYIAGIKFAWFSDISEIAITENVDKLIDIFIRGID
jgi:hypothetical protein